MPTVARLKEGDLILSGEVNERLPVVTNGLVYHMPFDGVIQAYVPNQIRYIRDWANGSTANTGNHWVEIQAIDHNGVNVALGKDVDTAVNIKTSYITDGLTTTEPYFSGGVGLRWVQVNLGDLYSLSEIKVWHYWGGTRSYYETKTEVSEDGITWFTIFDSAIEGTYVETSAGKTHNLGNLGATVKPSVNSNTTPTYDGIAVEEGTTNLVPVDNQKFESWSKHGGANVTVTQGVRVPEWSTSDATRISTTGGTDVIKYVRAFVNSPANQGKTYSIQVKVKNLSSTEMVIHSNAGNRSVKIKPFESTHVKLEGIALSSSNSSHLQIQFRTVNVGDSLDFIAYQPQVEEKSFPTSFVSGSRSAGRIDIPFNLKPPYSINIWHRGVKPLSEITDQTSSPMILQMNGYYTNASLSLWNYVKRISVYIKGNSASGWTTTRSYTTYTDTDWNNKEHMYTLVAVNNRTFKTYMDGVYLGEQTSTEDVTNISYLSMGNTSQPNAHYRDLSMYNRVLTDVEIKKLSDNKMSILSNGNLITSKLTEQPNGIPQDALHIPLDYNAKDRIGLIEPNTEANVIYENGSAWIGTAVTNAINQNDISLLRGYNSTDGSGTVAYQVDNGFWRVMRNNPSTGRLNVEVLMNKSYPVVAGQTWTESFLFRHDGTNIGFTITFFTSKHNTIKANIEQIGVGLYRASATYTVQTGETSIRAIDFNGITGDWTYIDIKDIQLEQKEFPTPYINGTRTTSVLYYPNEIIDATKDFTIFGFWKPQVVGDGLYYRPALVWNRLTSNSTYQRILIMNNGTETKSLRVWLPLTATSEANITISGSEIKVGQWNFFAFRRLGAGIKLYHGFDGKLLSGENSTSTPRIDALYSTVGSTWGWMIGRYANDSNTSDAHHRDYGFVNRAMSDDELLQLYNTPMSDKPDRLQLQSQIIEGATL